MKIDYISKASMSYEVRTPNRTSKYNDLNSAMKSAKDYTIDTGKVAYLYKCFGKTKKR